MNNVSHFYLYKAKIIDIYDGDTCTISINFGCNLTQRMKVRLYGINAPEMRGPEKLLGQNSKRHLQNLLGVRWAANEEYTFPIVVETIKDKRGKYGRYLAKIWVEQANLQDSNIYIKYDTLKNCSATRIDGKLMICINDIMVAEGQAKYKEY